MEPTTAVMQQSIHTLTTVVWILLIPIGLLLVAVLAKVLFILNDLGQFVSLAQYEVYPLLKDVRQIVHRADTMTHKVEAQTEKMIDSANKLKKSSSTIFGGVTTGLGLVLGAMKKNKKEK